MGEVQPAVPRRQSHQNDGELRQTAWWSSGHYEVLRSDALQGSRWGTGEYF